MTVLLTLPNETSIGLLTTSSSGNVQVGEVSVTQAPDEIPLEQEVKTFTGTNPIGIALPSGSKLAVGRGSLKSPTPIALKTFDNRPEGGAPRSTAIGLRVVVELPFSQLDLSNPMTQSLFVYAPAFDGAYESADHPVQEVAISLGGGKEYVFLDSYIPDFPVILTPAILEVVTSIFSDALGCLRCRFSP